MSRHRIIEGLPIAGIIAFSGCSVNALAHWLLGWSLNPTPWYWVAALLVEGCTAWLVWSVVDTLRMLTRSRISKQDRRFYKVIFLVFATLAIPSISASVVANYVEFQGNPLLACLFPVLTIACAVGAGLPEVVSRYKEQKQQEKDSKPAKPTKARKICDDCEQKLTKDEVKDGKCKKCRLLLRARAAGPDKRSQILELARPDENGTVLKQKEIGEILHTSPGWVSTIIRESAKSDMKEGSHGNLDDQQ